MIELTPLGRGRKDFSRIVEVSTVPMLTSHQNRIAWVYRGATVTLSPGGGGVVNIAPFPVAVDDAGGYMVVFYREASINIRENKLVEVIIGVTDYDLALYGYLYVPDAWCGQYIYGSTSMNLLYRYEYESGKNLSVLYPTCFFKLAPAVVLLNPTDKPLTITYDITVTGYYSTYKPTVSS